MKKILSTFLAFILLLGCSAIAEDPGASPVIVINQGSVLMGDLALMLEGIEDSDPLAYSQLNNAMGNNRLVYDKQRLYFCWNNSLYCAEYNGDDFWELTDMLQSGTSIAVSGSRVYFNSIAADTTYFTSIKVDGSEMPTTIRSFYGMQNELYGEYDYNWMARFARFVVPRDNNGRVYMRHHVSEMKYYQYDKNSCIEYSGEASYNITDNSFAKVANWRRTYSSNSFSESYGDLCAVWVQGDDVIYDSAVGDGIRLKNMTTNTTNVISAMNPSELISWNDKIYFIEKDTNKLYRMSNVGTQKRKLLDNVKSFVITDNGLLFYLTDDGLFAADQDGKKAILINKDIKERFYLLGDWIYWFTGTGLFRMSCYTGDIQTVFDPAWL